MRRQGVRQQRGEEQERWICRKGEEKERRQGVKTAKRSRIMKVERQER